MRMLPPGTGQILDRPQIASELLEDRRDARPPRLATIDTTIEYCQAAAPMRTLGPNGGTPESARLQSWRT